MVSFASFVLGAECPIYHQILRFVQRDLAAGTIQNGDELPSRRVLSARLGVNPNTIQKAYHILEEEGIMVSRSGAKSYTCADGQTVERIRREQLHEVDDLLKRYSRPAFLKTAERKFAEFQNDRQGRRTQCRRLWQKLYRLEMLNRGWQEELKKRERRLYQELSAKDYGEACRAFADAFQEKNYEYEQLLMYYIFCYLCGAVYDGDLFSKVKLAVVHTLLIRELYTAVWLEKGRELSFDDRVELAHRYARETEHSDRNMEAMEDMAAEEKDFCLKKLLLAVLG